MPCICCGKRPGVTESIAAEKAYKAEAEELYQEAQNCRDQAQKVNLLQHAASRGHLEAMLRLGFAYEYGNGISKNPYEALRWFRQAADQEFAPAQDRMAYCYDKGFGVERDLEKAIEWCQKAKNQNFLGAARHLRQLEEKKWRETPDISGNKPEFEILNGALLKYNGISSQVTVPGGVTRIGAKAFFGNDTIRSVKLPNGLIGMGAQAFAGCCNLREISIPGSVIAVNLDLFSGCRKLKKVTLESGVQKIDFGKHLDQLGSVCIVIPDSVRSATWSNMPDNQRTQRMKHPKCILASKRWTDLLQDFFSKNPDFRPGKDRRVGTKQVVLGVLAALLVFRVISIIDDSTDQRLRSDLASFHLDESVEDMLLAGTEQIYIYPDGTRMEFYYDDAGKEIYRVYVNTENDIENLFEASYDSTGRLVCHQIFDGQGNLLRTDSYDFDGSEGTAQRHVTLHDGRHFQGTSSFDENGYETFTVTHQDGAQTVYVYKDGGILATQLQYDAEGNSPEVTIGWDWESMSIIYGPWQTAIGLADDYGYIYYVQGICGGALKEFSIREDFAFIETYDPMGNLLERLYYRDGQMKELGSHEVHSYDQQGNYTGYTDIFYRGFGELPAEEDYLVATYDARGIRISSESHYGEDISYERYETELDDKGREIRVQTFDGETGRLISVDETEYDQKGNKAKTIRTAYHDDGDYSISIQDGERKYLSYILYYPNGNVQMEEAYNTEGNMIKTTRYYESGQIEYLREYDTQGNLTKNTSYYENGQIRFLTEYNDQGEVTRKVFYDEDGTVRQ